MKIILFLSFLLLQIQLMAQKPRLVEPVGHSSNITSVAISPEGNYFLTGSDDQTAKLWDRQGHEVTSFEGHEYFVEDVAFSPDGQSVLTGSYDGRAKLWDLEGNELQSFQEYNFSKAVFSVAFSPDGQHILTGSRDSTVKLWDLQGQEVQDFPGHMDQVESVAFSPDGQYILSGSSDSTAILWTLEGQEVQRFQGFEDRVMSVSFSPDGQTVLIGSLDGKVSLCDLQGNVTHSLEGYSECLSFSPDGKYILMGSIDNAVVLKDLEGRVVQTFAGHKEGVSSATFSKEGNVILTGSYDRSAKLWNAQPDTWQDPGQEVQRFQGYTSYVHSTVFSPDGQSLLIGSYDKTSMVWDLLERGIQTFKGHDYPVNAIAFSPDGIYVLTGSDDNTAQLWDHQGNKLQVFEGHEGEVSSLAFSPDGQYILTGSLDNTAKLWAVNPENDQGQVIRTFSGHEHFINTVAFSPDGQYVLTGSQDQTARLWDLNTGQEIQVFPCDEHHGVQSVAFSPDGQSVLVGGGYGAKLWDLNGNLIQELYPNKGIIYAAGFSPDGKNILTGCGVNVAVLWDLEGNQIRVFEGHKNFVASVAFSPNGEYILTGSFDNTAKLWNRQSGEEIATMINVNESDWVVTSPSGLFDASPGTMHLMHYVQGLEVIGLEQLKERYYEPGLLSHLLGNQEGDVRDVSTFKEVALYPETEASIQQDRLNISLKARSGGIGKVSLFVNNKEKIQDANPERKTSLSIDLKQFAHYYTEGENMISLRTYNADGWLKSAAIELTYSPSYPVGAALNNTSSPSPRPAFNRHLTSLYIISVGTSDYGGTQLDLAFAGKDAISMEAAFKEAGGQLFQDRVYPYLFTTEEGGKSPSKSNIQAAFSEIAAIAQPQDIMVLYLSGHGVTYGPAEKANFYYLTKDIGSEDLSDTEIRRNYAISDDELTDWMTNIPAHKQVMILDACNSGKVVENLLSGKKKLNATQVVALDRMKDRTGMFVLAGSAADKVSYEATPYGQGLLTFSLLSGMSGQALGDNGQVDVMKLFQFSRDKVPSLAKSIKGIQTPMMAFPEGGSSFDIGIVNEQVNIPVSQVKPVFIRSVFLDREEDEDELEIGDKLNAYLEKITAKGTKASLVFINTSKRLDKNSYSIKGSYVVADGNIEIKGKLRKGRQVVHTINLTGEESDVNSLVKQIMREVFEHLKE